MIVVLVNRFAERLGVLVVDQLGELVDRLALAGGWEIYGMEQAV